MVSAASEALNWNSLPPMMLPARSCSIAGVVDISRVTRTSTGRVNVDATVPTASQVSVLFEVDRLRKSVSVALKKFGVGALNVDVLERSRRPLRLRAEAAVGRRRDRRAEIEGLRLDRATAQACHRDQRKNRCTRRSAHRSHSWFVCLICKWDA